MIVARDAPLYVGVIHGNVERGPEVSLVHEMLPHHTFEVGVEEFEQHALRPRQPQAIQQRRGRGVSLHRQHGLRAPHDPVGETNGVRSVRSVTSCRVGTMRAAR